MQVYMHYMYVYMYAYVCIYLCMQVHISVRIYVCMYVCMTLNIARIHLFAMLSLGDILIRYYTNSCKE